MSTLADVNTAIAAYQQSEVAIQAEIAGLQAAYAALSETTATHQAAVDAAAVAVAAAQANADAVQAVVNGLVNDQNNSFQGILTKILAYVPE
jgi:peptidoglycan hydrolase CwlO-like protein